MSTDKSVNVVEAKAKFSELMARVAYQGQRVIVERHGTAMMAWVSMDDLSQLERLGGKEEAQVEKDDLTWQQELVAAGLIAEVKPRSARTFPPAADEVAEIQGEPISATIIRERR